MRRYLLPQREALDRLSRLTDSPFSAPGQVELVAGLPGMEFRGSFWVIVLLMLALAGLIMAIFRTRKWLQRDLS